ncbi:MAG: WD40 repeat domain-containing protein, partial [Anaerolineae bacterium]|nr:WD40 repeat domain-containing protein [Anaerolineae bacterium]
AMETDLSHVKEHTRLLVRAREWDSGSRPKSGLLEGETLIKAEGWLAQAVYKNPAPTPLHQEYIFASRRHEINRQRTIIARVVTALVIAVAMAVLSFFLFLRARDAEQQARRSERKAADALVESEKNLRDAWNTQSRFLAAQSTHELEIGSPQTALLLAVESLAHYTDGIYHLESYVALVNALRSPVREEAYMSGEGLVQTADWSTEGIFSYYSNALNSAFWIKLWETNGTLRQTIDNIQGSAGLSPDKSRFVTWTKDNTLTLWNADGTKIQSLTLDTPIYSVWWNSDGSQLMIISDSADLSLWSLADNTAQDFEIDFFWDSVELSPDESQFYFTSNGSLIVWDIKTNQQVRTYARPPETPGGSLPEFPDLEQTIDSSTFNATILWNPDKTRILFVQDTDVHVL